MLKMIHFLLMTFFISGVFSFNYGGIPKEFDQRNAQSIISLLESNNTNFNAENFDPKELYNLNWISILADVIKAYNGSKAMKLGDLSVECLNSLQPYAYLLKLKPSDLNPAVLWKILSSPAGKSMYCQVYIFVLCINNILTALQQHSQSFILHTLRIICDRTRQKLIQLFFQGNFQVSFLINACYPQQQQQFPSRKKQW